MSDGCATACAGETAIRDQCYGRSQPHSGNCRSRVQHLTHTRSALRAFVTDHHNITCHDLAALDGCDRIFFTVKYSCRSFMYHHFRYYGGTFYHTAVRCQVALQYGNTAGLAVRIVDRPDDFRIHIDAAFDIFCYGLARYRDQIGIEQILLAQFVHHRIYTAGFIQVFHIGRACRCQMAQVRCLCGQFVCDIQVQIHTGFICDGRQMQHGVGGAAQCHIHGQSIHKCLLRHDIARTDVLFNQFHDFHTRMLCQADTLGIYCRDSSVALKAHTQSFR